MASENQKRDNLELDVKEIKRAAVLYGSTPDRSERLAAAECALAVHDAETRATGALDCARALSAEFLHCRDFAETALQRATVAVGVVDKAEKRAAQAVREYNMAFGDLESLRQRG